MRMFLYVMQMLVTAAVLSMNFFAQAYADEPSSQVSVVPGSPDDASAMQGQQDSTIPNAQSVQPPLVQQYKAPQFVPQQQNPAQQQYVPARGIRCSSNGACVGG